MQRLLIINHASELGGSEYGLLDIARHYGPERCHVVLFGDGPLRERLDRLGVGVTILQAGKAMMGVTREAGRLRALAALPSMLAMMWRLGRLARGYDVLYSNSQKAAVVTMMVGPLVGRPVIWHLHDILSKSHFASFQRWVVVTLANRVARDVIAISEASRLSFVESGGDPDRVKTVFNGVDTARFEDIYAVDVDTVRKSLGLRSQKLVGLFGRITPWKGQHVLLEALSHLPDTHALLVGDALFGEDDYKKSLLTLADRLGVANRVHWLGYRSDTPTLMRSVDIVLHTSTSPEPFGRVIIEGLLAGRPVLATSHGASRELLGENDNWLVEPGDATALADAIRRTFAFPAATLNEMVTRERSRVMSLFSLQAMMHGIERIVGLPA